jgi:hypothetical protein
LRALLTCFPTAGKLGLQRVEVRRPELTEAVEPGVGIAQPGWIDRVQATRAFGAGGGEASFAEDAEVSRYARLGDAELTLDDGGDGARGEFAHGEELEDAAADGIAEDVERVHHSLLYQ